MAKNKKGFVLCNIIYMLHTLSCDFTDLSQALLPYHHLVFMPFSRTSLVAKT